MSVSIGPPCGKQSCERTAQPPRQSRSPRHRQSPGLEPEPLAERVGEPREIHSFAYVVVHAGLRTALALTEWYNDQAGTSLEPVY